MTDFFSAVWAAVGWSVAWQSTLALAAGLLATAVYARRPARADGLLVASVLAALVAPVGTFAIHELGWGVLAANTSTDDVPEPVAQTPAPNHLARDEQSFAITFDDPKTMRLQMPAAMESLAGGMHAESAEQPFPRDVAPASATARAVQLATAADLIATDVHQPSAWVTFVRPTLLGIWLVISTAALARLAASVWAGRRLLATSPPVSDARIDRALRAAAARLGLAVRVEARRSARVHCPVIWCWSRRPVVLLPDLLVERTDESACLGIFCHELAHWKRRDHLASLALELLCCALPWQPLAWWARRRHDQLSELACDEWVLASGHSAESYAESLLDLIPQRGARLALAVLRDRRGLVGRIRHILQIGRAQPALGKLWVGVVTASTVALVVVAALAQQQPPVGADTSGATTTSDGTTVDTAHVELPHDRSQHVTGVVRDLSEKPVAGAHVYWVGLVQGNWGTVPHDDPRREDLVLLADGITDEEGRFTMSADFDAKDYRFPSIVVRHAEHGLGLRSYAIAEQHKLLEIHLPQATPIEGKILDANGMPVAGAEILPTHIQALVRLPKKPTTDEEESESSTESDSDWGWLSLSASAQRGGALPAYWPKPVKTAADGRFTIPGSDNCGTELLRVAAAGFGSHGVTVSDAESVSDWKKTKPDRDRSPPLANPFTLILEPPRTIEGTFTDSQTGHPVAGVEIVMESSRDSGYIWNRQVARATSDAQGQYRFLAPATGRDQSFHIYPPLGYAPLGGRIYLEREFAKLFGNSRLYRNDIRLTPSPIVRGRVIDADSQAPVADAAVNYQPGRANPNIDRGDFTFHEPVLTDGNGEFQITALSGTGVISIDTRSDQHVRETIPASISNGRSDVSPHAFAPIDVPATGEAPPLTLVVHRGADLLVEPIGPDGQAVTDVTIAFHEVGTPVTHQVRSRREHNTSLRLSGCGPGKTYRLLIGTPNCELGAVADVKFDSTAEPVKVSLQPTGVLRGKLVWADGSPASDVNTFLHFHDDPSAAKHANGLLGAVTAQKLAARTAQNLPFYNNVLTTKTGSRTTTDANGEFEIIGIVPGVFLNLTVNYDFPSGERHQPAGTIEAGQTIDMGQLVIKP